MRTCPLCIGVAGIAALTILTGLGQPSTKPGNPRPQPVTAPPGQPVQPRDVKPVTPPPSQPADEMQAVKPGPEHKILERFTGHWTCETSAWFGPEPDISQGTMTFTPVLGGRQIREEFKSDNMMGEPFEGLGYWGYDTIKKHYVVMWTDTMSSTFATGTGSYDAAKNTFTINGGFDDPASGAHMRTREVTTFTDNDHFTFTMYMLGGDSGDTKVLEIKATRAGARGAAEDDANDGTVKVGS